MQRTSDQNINTPMQQMQNNIINLLEEDMIFHYFIDYYLKIPEHFNFFQFIMSEVFSNVIKSNNDTFKKIVDQ